MPRSQALSDEKETPPRPRLRETHGQYIARAVAWAEARWDRWAQYAQKHRLELVPMPSAEDLDLHCEWAVRYYVLDQKPREIAPQVNRSIQAVEKALHQLRPYLGFAAPRRRGRPRERRHTKAYPKPTSK